MPKISIIVPVHNVERYLRRCLNSLVYQSEKDIEIIVVDDVSTDGSGAIIDEYASRDKRIVSVQHQTNRRQGGARNTGLEMAKGDYVWFVDSDDFVDTNACELLYATAKVNHLDILATNRVELVGSEVVYNENYKFQSHLHKIVSGKKYFWQTLMRGQWLSSCIYSYLFRRELLDGEKFREKVFIEDLDYIALLVYKSKRIMDIGYSPYFRLLRDSSTMNTFDKVSLRRAKLKAFEAICEKSSGLSLLGIASYIQALLLKIKLVGK